jgi:hypothetical protein
MPPLTVFKGNATLNDTSIDAAVVMQPPLGKATRHSYTSLTLPFEHVEIDLSLYAAATRNTVPLLHEASVVQRYANVAVSVHNLTDL